MGIPKEQSRQIIAENDIKEVGDIYALFKESFKDIPQELLEAEMEASIGYAKNNKASMDTEDKRNGYSPKTVKSQCGQFQVDMLRGRNREFEPMILHKHQRDILGIEEKLSPYTGGEWRPATSTASFGICTGSSRQRKWSAGLRIKSCLASGSGNLVHWNPFFQFGDGIRRIMYTANIIEGMNRQFRKATKTKSVFPSDASLEKTLYRVPGMAQF